MDMLSTAKVAEALVRSPALTGRKILAIKIMRAASVDSSGVCQLGLKEAKELVDAAEAMVQREQVISEREMLAADLVMKAALPNDLLKAAAAYTAHVAEFGHLGLKVVQAPSIEY